ncbi:MAG: OmpA family protein [Acidobacteria bacterium]|nr:OmpA family protein [Acidobacteriota bacterium]
MAAQRRKRGGEEAEHENHERWLLTYADMITLLMVLFVVLFSISQTDLAKFAQLREGLASSFGTETPALKGSSGVLQGAKVSSSDNSQLDGGSAGITLEQAAAVEHQKLDNVKDQVENQLQKAGLQQQVKIENKQRGLVITVLTDDVLFDLGRANLRPEGQALMDGLSSAINTIPNQVVIEGHTDNQPIRGGGQFATNWELSTARATTVLRYLLDHDHVAASRLSAAGYADQRPLAPNDTPEHKQLNRRVEIVVVSATDQPAPLATTTTTAPAELKETTP